MRLNHPGILFAACLLAAVGCGGKEGDDQAAAPDVDAGPPVAVAGIDPETRLDLDGGRVSVFSPSGWKRSPRGKDYLVRYQQTMQLPLPSVVVVASDPPAGITEVTPQTQAAFVEAMAARLAEEFGGEGRPALLRKPAAVTVGPHRAVGWSVPGEARLDGPPKKIERDCTAVVVDGRLYTVEAWAPRGKLDDATRSAARAVAAALAVPVIEPAPAEPAPAEPAPAEPAPAEPAPAEPAPAEPAPAEPAPAEPAPAEPAAAE